jgi:hypothetical protein
MNKHLVVVYDETGAVYRRIPVTGERDIIRTLSVLERQLDIGWTVSVEPDTEPERSLTHRVVKTPSPDTDQERNDR